MYPRCRSDGRYVISREQQNYSIEHHNGIGKGVNTKGGDRFQFKLPYVAKEKNDYYKPIFVLLLRFEV